MAEVESIKSDVLPYDFVKENDVIVSKTTNGYVATSPYELTLDIYKEIQRYLNCLLYTSPSPRDVEEAGMPSWA